MKVWNKRERGVPAAAVYVGRPTVFGNPFTVTAHGRDHAVQLYEQWIMDPEQACLRAVIRRDLVGRDLVCWCAPNKCHADTIMRIANGERTNTQEDIT